MTVPALTIPVKVMLLLADALVMLTVVRLAAPPAMIADEVPPDFPSFSPVVALVVMPPEVFITPVTVILASMLMLPVPVLTVAPKRPIATSSVFVEAKVVFEYRLI